MKSREEMIITKYDLLYESRMTRVETALEGLGKDVSEIKKDIKTDFRWLLGIILVCNGSLFGIISHGFKWW